VSVVASVTLPRKIAQDFAVTLRSRAQYRGRMPGQLGAKAAELGEFQDSTSSPLTGTLVAAVPRLQAITSRLRRITIQRWSSS
jgi:hypothetical protein